MLGVSSVCLTVYTSALIYTLAKVRLNIFFRTSLVLTLYEISFIAKVAMDAGRCSFDGSNDHSYQTPVMIALRYINATAERFRWFVLYFFIFEA